MILPISAIPFSVVAKEARRTKALASRMRRRNGRSLLSAANSRSSSRKRTVQFVHGNGRKVAVFPTRLAA